MPAWAASAVGGGQRQPTRGSRAVERVVEMVAPMKPELTPQQRLQPWRPCRGLVADAA